ncbi:hypothetical protein BMS3Bbin11_00115 [bacterium BMS3Bbin11]|nr:hypothetical protein BMS3Bbin11_00115 [bacterium BMS3Bbin11]
MSNNGRENELLGFLELSSLPYAYEKQEKSSRYDANTHASIGLRSGQYYFLHGNSYCCF